MEKIEAEHTAIVPDGITIKESRVEGKEYGETRAAVHREEDEFGGSWFDDFTDESGMEWKENVSILNGEIRIGWLEGWKYRRSIDLVNNGRPLQDYPIQLNLSAQDFNYSRARDQGEDIRIVGANESYMNYWIEEWNTSGNSSIWSNVSRLPPGSSRLWMYYGNSNADPMSNASKTFSYYEDWTRDNTGDWKYRTPDNEGNHNTYWENTTTFPFNKTLESTFTLKEWNKGKWDWAVVGWSSDRTSVWDDVDHCVLQWNMMENAGATDSKIPVRLSLRNGAVRNETQYIIVDKPDPNHVLSLKIIFNSMEVMYEWKNLDTGVVLASDGLTGNNSIPSPELVRFLLIQQVDEKGGIFSWHSPTHLKWGNIHDNGGGEWHVDVWSVRKQAYPEINVTLGMEHDPSSCLVSKAIQLPQNYHWSTLNIKKTEPANTLIEVTIINALSNETIPGYNGISLRYLDISNITANSIRLNGCFNTDGTAIPSLDSWGVEWTTENAWRDSFTGDAKVASQQKADENTAAMWHFDEARGNVVRDISGNGNNGTVEGADRCVGKFGGGLKFNGRTGRVSVPDSDSLDILDELTIELWAKPLDLYDAPTPGAWEWLLIKGSDDDWYGTYSLAMDMAGRITFRLEDSTRGMHSLGFEVLDTNNYVQLAYVYDGQNMLIYKNGNLMASKHVGSFTIMESSRDLYLWWHGGGNRHVGGILDEVRISSTSRTPEEIRRSYQGGIIIRGGEAFPGENGMETGRGCVGYWPCDETGGDTLKDSSGNGNEGTINGTNRTYGVFGNALAFDGMAEVVDCGNDASLQNSNVTVECWINPSDLSESYQTIISKSTKELDGYAIMCHDGGVLMEFSGPWVRSIGKSGCFSPGTWYHLAMTYGSNEFVGYLNGEVFGKINYNMAVPTSQPFKIGNGYDTMGINGITGFNGLIDSVSVHNRVLGPREIFNRSGLHPPESHMNSEIISLPQDQTWETLHVNSTVPDNTYLNISVHDPMTDDVILNETTRIRDGIISLASINSLKNPSIYLRANFRSNRTETPVIHNWAVKWASMVYPELVNSINDTWVAEDTLTAGILDLSMFFNDAYSHIEPSVYDITYVSDLGNITLNITNSSLDVIGLAPNFTGNVGIIVSCTNVYNLSRQSNMFNITIIQIDDPPFWNSALPEVLLDEDSTVTTDWSLDDFVDDAEDDTLDFTATPEDERIECSVEDGNELTITATDDYYGETIINVLGYETNNRTLSTENVTMSVKVKAVNDPPEAELVDPANGSVLGDANVSFSWYGSDVDNDASELTYDLYLGKGRIPEVYRSHIQGTKITIRGLDDGVTYYWYVLPHDGELPGDRLNGTWSFSIDTSIRIPTLKLSYPLNNITINTTDVNLSWEVVQPGLGDQIFHIYGGSSEDALGEIFVTEKTWHYLEDLNDNSTYYWRVIPFSDSVEGKCLSGVWRFSINTSYEGGKNLTVIPDVERLEMVKGKGIGFNITLINNDLVPLNVTINVTGIFSDMVNISRSVHVIPGTLQSMRVNITGTSNLSAGDYNLTLVFRYLDRTEVIIIPVTIKEDKTVNGDDDDDDHDGDTDKSMFFDNISVIVGMVVLALALAVILYFALRKRRKDGTREEKDSEEAMAAEIVPVEESVFAQSEKHSYAKKTKTADTSPFKAPQTGSTPVISGKPLRSSASPSPSQITGQTPSPSSSTFDASGIPSPPPAPQGASAVPSPSSAQQGASAVPLTSSAQQGASADPSPSSTPQSASAIPSTPPVSAQEIHGASQESIVKGPQIVGIDKGFTLTDIFLIYVDGRLIKSVSFETQLREGMDEDIMSGMLTAITDFIQDSFKEDTGALKTLQYGKMTIFLERGVGMYVAVVFHGNPVAELREKMRWLLIRLWKKFKYRLKVWDGSYDGLDGLSPMLRSMMEQEEKDVQDSEEKETATPAAKPDKAAVGPGPVVSVATEAVMCDICMGVVKPGLEIMGCNCGNKFHKSCGERVGECPKCSSSLSVSEPKKETVTGTSGETGAPTPSEEATEPHTDPMPPVVPDIDSIFDIPLDIPSSEEKTVPEPEPVLPSGEHEEEGGTKVLPEFSGQEAGEIDEFRIEI